MYLIENKNTGFIHHFMAESDSTVQTVNIKILTVIGLENKVEDCVNILTSFYSVWLYGINHVKIAIKLVSPF